MDRKDFLLSACALCGVATALSTMQGCSKDVAPTNFTLDLSSSSNAALANVGGYVIANNGNTYVTRTSTTSFLALSLACTHQGTTVIYNSATAQFTCPNHHSQFASNGAVQSGPASTNLNVLNVTQSGNILTIKS